VLLGPFFALVPMMCMIRNRWTRVGQLTLTFRKAYCFAKKSGWLRYRTWYPGTSCTCCAPTGWPQRLHVKIPKSLRHPDFSYSLSDRKYGGPWYALQ